MNSENLITEKDTENVLSQIQSTNLRPVERTLSRQTSFTTIQCVRKMVINSDACKPIL